MNKRFWMAFVACYIAGFMINGLVHGVWLDPTYKALAAVFRPEAEMNNMMWLNFLSSAIAVFAFCFIYTKGYEAKGVMEGVRYGSWVALLVAIPGAMMALWVYPVPTDLAIKWGVAGAAYWIVLGAVLAAIYKPGAQAA